MSAMLELRDVEARYGQVQALRGITLQVPEGAIVAVLGANGAGKTTTLRAVSGTVRRSGTITFDGKPLRGGPEAVARAGIACRPEEWEGYLILADVLVAAGRKPEAVRVTEQAVKMAHPNEPRPKQALEALKKP